MDPLPASPTHAHASPADDVLMHAIQGGDDAALGLLYDRYGRLAFALAYRLLGERGAAEDVVQEAFLTVWRRAGHFEAGRGAARSWLMTIVHHLAIDRRRGRHRRDLANVPLDDVAGLLPGQSDPFAQAAAGIDAARVHAALAALPADQRQAIELAYFAGLTHQEIAERVDAPLGTIKGRLRLGLQKLRAALGDVALDPGTGEP